MTFAPGARLGPYEILSLLGEGGMGVVYRARDPRLGREVALKVLPSEVGQNPERRQRFEREARAAAGVNHPHIVTLYSVEEAESTLFITMELVEGRSLRDVLLEGPLPVKKLLDLAVPLAEAAHAAHRQGITHRDLKPENVMITPDGWVKVLDFGLAKLVRPNPGDEGQTQAATLLTSEGPKGTVAYMSPEQAAGRSLDSRTDIFSLGVMLYEMATGQRPFHGENTVSTLSAILRDEPRPAADLRRDMPPHLGRVIQRCLAKTPDRRYQTALDLRNELDTIREELRTTSDSGSLARKAAEAAREAGPKRIVVLPFENLGATDDAFFAAGITEEITSRLAAVSGLKVASRTTAVQYDRTGKTLGQVGLELGVDYVLEGTVRWARKGDASRVRVTPQLIRVSDDSHLWADRYDRDLDDIFDVQSEIAEAVVKQLGVALEGSQQKAMAARPTRNMDAYQAYLRGLDYAGRMDYSAENFESALRMFGRAVELDPDFAQARARLAYFHAQTYFFGYDRTPDRLAKVKAEAEEALALAPELAEAHQALGKYYYAGPRDYAKAIEEFEIAHRGLPNQADLVVDLGAAHRRMGDFDTAHRCFQEAESMEPHHPQPIFEQGMDQFYLRRYEEAQASFERVIAITPDLPFAYGMAATVRMGGWGDLAGARRFLELHPGGRRVLPGSEPPQVTLFLLERDGAGLERWLARDMHDTVEGQYVIAPPESYRALAHELRGDAEAAQASYLAALERLERDRERLGNDPRFRSALGIALAGLGRSEEALQEARASVELLPVAKDAMVGPVLEERLGWIEGRVGLLDGAVARVERLLAIPSWLSLQSLRLDPRWDPLRSHPRFQALVAE